MSEVGRVTIEPVVHADGTSHAVSATVNVGGSLVEVRLDTEQDPELKAVIDKINAKVSSLAVRVVQASLRP